MPRVVRWIVRSALIYLVLSALVGALALSSAAPLPPGLLALRPLGWHLLMLGWATQLALGVALWMFPVLSREQPRGDERLIWAAFATLNIGLGLRAIGEPAASLWPGALPIWVLPVSATLQVAGIWIFVVLLWPRVKTLGK